MKHRAISRRLLPVACAGLGIAAAANAQTLIRSINGDGIYDRMGVAVANAGDVDLDGNPDMIVGATEDFQIFFNEPGYARIVSGADGSTIRTLVGDADFDLFGVAVTGLGDLNGDGHAEVAVGAPYAVAPGDTLSGGLVRVFSGIDGSVMWSVYGEEGDELGTSVGAAGDANDDGVPDVVAGAPRADVGLNDSVGSGGKVQILSGVDGSVLVEVEGTVGNQRLGISVDGIGNVNPSDMVLDGDPPASVPDTFDDVIVGSLFGGAKILSGFDGSVLASFTSVQSDIYGRSVASIEDLNGDGFRDAVIGASQEDFLNTGSGYVDVRSGKKNTGQVLFSIDGDLVGERFGFDVADAGDWDGDGLHDILVGTSPNQGNQTSYIGLYSGVNGSEFFTIDGNNQDEGFGHSVAGLGDGDADGKSEIAVGVPQAQPNGLGSGTLRVYESPFSLCGEEVEYCAATVNSTGSAATLANLGGTSVADNDMLLFASNLPVGQPGVFFYGSSAANTPFGAGTLCVGGQFTNRLGFVPAQPGGIAFFSVDYTAETDPNVTITGGSTWFFQYWFRDPAGGLGPNFSNALEVNFCE